MNERDIIDRLIKTCAEFQEDNYGEWTIRAIPLYQEILDDLGLPAIAVVGGPPDDGNTYNIVLRMPWGAEEIFPDPERIDKDGKTTYDPKYIVTASRYHMGQDGGEYYYIRELVLFLVKLGEMRHEPEPAA